ncbi:MAG: hypothetical protein ACREQJ_01670 [Candidatus Binatia bacterium]
MAEVLPLSESELRLLAALLRNRVRFMVVGLSAAALQGAPVVTEAVDLWFEDLGGPNLRKALKDVGAAYVPAFGLNPPMLAGPGSEIFDVVISMSGLRPFADEAQNALEIEVGGLKLKILPLERILASKTAADRPKDRLVIPVLRNVLRTVNVMRDKRAKSTPKRGSSRRNRRKSRTARK